MIRYFFLHLKRHRGDDLFVERAFPVSGYGLKAVLQDLALSFEGSFPAASRASQHALAIDSPLRLVGKAPALPVESISIFTFAALGCCQIIPAVDRELSTSQCRKNMVQAGVSPVFIVIQFLPDCNNILWFIILAF
ncbi:MAG: hypothetical protein AB9903_24665 [Vulcanimicrobiota bacterium]